MDNQAYGMIALEGPVAQNTIVLPGKVESDIHRAHLRKIIEDRGNRHNPARLYLFFQKGRGAFPKTNHTHSLSGFRFLVSVF